MVFRGVRIDKFNFRYVMRCFRKLLLDILNWFPWNFIGSCSDWFFISQKWNMEAVFCSVSGCSEWYCQSSHLRHDVYTCMWESLVWGWLHSQYWSVEYIGFPLPSISFVNSRTQIYSLFIKQIRKLQWKQIMLYLIHNMSLDIFNWIPIKTIYHVNKG